MKKIVLALFSLLFSLNASAFTYESSSESTASILPDDNVFLSAQWLKEEYLKNPTKNIVISPMSVYLISTLLQSGANGETLQELTKLLNTTALQFQNKIYEKAVPYKNPTISDYLESLSPNIQISNSLWGDFFTDTFKKNAKDIFKADIFQLPENTSEINAYIREKTKGKIKGILGERAINTEDNLFLVNTIYFKDEWQIPFESYATQKAIFQMPNGKKETAMMRRMYHSLPYFENSRIQAIALPYKNGDMMYLILPKKDIPFSEFMKDLTYKDIFLNMKKLPVSVEIPRFKIEGDKISLKELFQKWGVQRIFNPYLSELNDVSEKNAFVTSFLHQSVIEIDETGTEAAAVTALSLEASGMLLGLKRQEMVLEFVADRPFIFMLNDGLFIGIVNEPDDYIPYKEKTLFP